MVPNGPDFELSVPGSEKTGTIVKNVPNPNTIKDTARVFRYWILGNSKCIENRRNSKCKLVYGVVYFVILCVNVELCW